MTNILPLDQIRLNVHSHLSALRWIGLLYRKPRKLRIGENGLSLWQRANAVLWIYFHTLPYLLIFNVLGRWLLFDALGLKVNLKPALVPGWNEGLWFHTPQIVLGLAVGLAGALAVGLAIGELADGLALGLAGGLVGGLVGGLGVGLVSSVAFGFVFGLAFGLTSRLVGNLVFGLSVCLAGTIGFGWSGGIAVGLSFCLCYIIGFFRLYYLAVHGFLFWLMPQPNRFRFHPVAWDDVCLLPFPGLDRLLAAYAEHAPEAGRDEIDYLIGWYPSQRLPALRAQALVIVRRASATVNLAQLDEIFADSPAGERGFLKEIPELRRQVHEISTLQAQLDTIDRPLLRVPFAALLVKEIESMEQKISRFKEPLSTELRKAARRWRDIATSEHEAARTAAAREPTRQVFSAGNPVDREREAFVLRTSILSELERQVMLTTGCPGLLIYGRRRMGKSTLLRNLEGFLPQRVRIAKLSMQKAQAFVSLPDLMSLIFRQVADVVPNLAQPSLDLKGFERFLDATQKSLAADDRRLFLAFDEYENLDSKIGEGVLPEDLLAVIRESIQAHSRIIWTFVGSHSIDELTNASWTSYLVSARTLEITPSAPAETRLLLTEPLKHSSLWQVAEAERPRFEPGFWGDGGIERMHTETAGWPHLVQLVAENVVDLVNDNGGTSVDEALFKRAMDRAVRHGDNVFFELLEYESRLPGEWAYLRTFRSVDEQPPPTDEALARSLRRRRLVLEEQGYYRLRVPLMARWLRQQA